MLSSQNSEGGFLALFCKEQRLGEGRAGVKLGLEIHWWSSGKDSTVTRTWPVFDPCKGSKILQGIIRFFKLSGMFKKKKTQKQTLAPVFAKVEGSWYLCLHMHE